MMNETPLYFQEFLRDFGSFKQSLDKKFEGIDKKIDNLTASTAQGFKDMHNRFNDLEKITIEGFHDIHIRVDNVEDSIEKIQTHVGRSEIKISNIDKILLNHENRITRLEQA